MLAALKVLLAVALVGAGLPSGAGTRTGGIDAAPEAFTRASAAASPGSAWEIYNAAPGLAADALLAAREVPASTAVGRKGAPMQNPTYQPVQNTPTTIGGRDYTGHALDQMPNRGLTPSVIEDTIARGTQSAGRDGATIFQTDQARVILNPNGSVKTVMPMSQ